MENTKIVPSKAVEDLKIGTFVIVTYDFASASSPKYVTKKFVALVTCCYKEVNTVEVQYATAINNRRVKITSTCEEQINC